MWGYNTNMGQFGGPMTPQMNMGGGPRGFSPWMQGMPNGFTPPNFANNMGEVFGGMPGGGPMQFNMGSQPGKSPGNPMTNMPGQARPPMPGMGGANPPNFFPGFGGGKPGGGQGGILPWLLPQGQGGGNQTRPMEIPPHIAQILGYTKPTNDIGKESPSKGNNGWLNDMLRSNPYMGGTGGGGYMADFYNGLAKSGGKVGLGGQMDMATGGVLPGFMNVANAQPNSRSMGGFNPRMMGGGRGSSQLFPQQQFDPRLLAMPSIKGQDTWNGGGMGMGGGISPQQLQQLMGMFGGNPGGGMGNPNAPYSSNPNHMVYM